MNDLLLEIPTEYDEEILIPPVWYVIDKVVWVQKSSSLANTNCLNISSDHYAILCTAEEYFSRRASKGRGQGSADQMIRCGQRNVSDKR